MAFSSSDLKFGGLGTYGRRILKLVDLQSDLCMFQTPITQFTDAGYGILMSIEAVQDKYLELEAPSAGNEIAPLSAGILMRDQFSPCTCPTAAA
jgi:hypothetical protein